MYEFSLTLVRLHTQEGFPLDISLDMAAERGLRPCLLGLVVGMATAGFGVATFDTYVAHWKKLYAS